MANPEHFLWSPSAKGEPGATIDAAKTMAIFDFDCTLSAVHLFKVLRSYDGQQEMMRDAGAFFDRIFGGAARIEALQAFIKGLAERGVELRVLSFGNEGEISAALQHIGVEGYFQGIYGNVSYDKYQVVSVREAKQQMLMLFQHESPKENLLFVDDDRFNFPQTSLAAPLTFDRFKLEAAHDAAAAGLAGVTQHIFPAGPSKDSTGLSPADMESILAYVAAPEGGVPATEPEQAGGAPTVEQATTPA